MGLKEDYESLLQFFCLCPVGVVEANPSGEVAQINTAAAKLLLPACPAGDLANIFDTLQPWAPGLRKEVERFEEPSGTIIEQMRLPVTPEDGPPRVLGLTLLKIDSRRLMAVLLDVSRTVAQERRLVEQKEAFRVIFDNVRDHAIFSMDREGRINSWNKSAERVTGFSGAEALGRDYSLICAPGGRSGSWSKALEQAVRKGWHEAEGWCLRKGGEKFWANSVISVLEGSEGELLGFSVVARDVSDRKKMEDRLRRMAATDPLTGVANRRRFYELAEAEAQRWKRYGGRLSLALIDVDNFKQLNDAHGHLAGDEALRTLARLAEHDLRHIDLLGRLGGEEFGILLPGTRLADACQAAQRLRSRVEGSTLSMERKPVRFTISVGVAEMKEPMEKINDLVRQADAALYRAKAQGRNRVAALH